MTKVFNNVRVREYDNGQYLCIADCAKAVGYASSNSVASRISHQDKFKRPSGIERVELLVAAPDVIREALNGITYRNAVAFRKWLADNYIYGAEESSEETPFVAEVNDHKAVAQIDESLEMFDFGGHNVRVVLQGGEPWFVLKDVCDVLGLRVDAAKTRLDQLDHSTTGVENTRGQKVQMAIVNESGLYDVILDSRKPEAKKFRRWVTSEVLPSIRRDGGYIKGQENMTGEELMAKALQFADSRIKSLEAKVAADKPMVEFAEAVQGCDEAITLTEMSKILDSTVCPMNVYKMSQALRDAGYLFKNTVGGSTLPIRKWTEEGIFTVHETGYWSNTSRAWIPQVQTRVTGKGQLFLVEKFKSGELTTDTVRV